VTLSGKGVPGIAMFRGGDNEEYPVPAGADGSYSFDLPPGFWTAWAKFDNALCLVTGATVEDGKQVQTDLPCALYKGRFRKKHHQTKGTCNSPVPDFEATLAIATRLSGGRTLMDVTYDGGNENTVVAGEVDSENTFRGSSGFDDAGGGATVQEHMIARFELQLDGTIVFTGTSAIEFRVNGAVFCTKQFEINGTKTGS
jgi:hypothetical protein